MLSIHKLIRNKVKPYIKQEVESNHSIVGNLVKYLKTTSFREPQIESIEVYLWIKFVGDGQRLSEIVKQGLLYDDEIAKEYKYYQVFGNNYTLHFLNQFAEDNDLKNLQDILVNDSKGENHDWNQILAELLHNFDYPNYLFSLPMGAGKTFLMAAFIYLDLYFANLFPNDHRFAHNFVVFAPSASKTAILPSLQTIKNFNPTWVLPPDEAKKIQQLISIEILDSLSSKRKDKLHGNNPNLEKVNSLTQYKDFGMVFITNAEKVVLEKYSEEDQALINSPLFADEIKIEEIKKTNDLREKLSEIPYLSVILDEVHHSYGTTGNGEKKLRQAVNVLNQNKNLVCVLGLSGTPYIKNQIKIGSSNIRLNQIQDIVYDYSLADGIGKFLKNPEVISLDRKQDVFIKNALTKFFTEYDVTYNNGTKSKIAFYCPSIKKLNEDILPVIKEWYAENRPGNEDEIFRYYSKVKKDEQKYQLPNESKAVFNNLDKPYSNKRVILLVAIGTEGWDCRSLTSVALPRQKTTKNFVLQTTARCLREVEEAENENALIFLSKDNYETLDSELQQNYKLNISDLKASAPVSVKVKKRKPKLGKLKYNQVYSKYKIYKKTISNLTDALDSYDFSKIKEKFEYDTTLIKGKIGKDGIVSEKYESYEETSEILNYDFNDFLYDINKNLFGRFSEFDLISEYGNSLLNIFNQIESDLSWIAENPNLSIKDVVSTVSTIFNDIIEYEEETVEEETEIELLEWNLISDRFLPYEGGNFVPEISAHQIRGYNKHPERWEEDYFNDENNIDPLDMSFNYVPYRMDSEFEKNAIHEMLKMSELKDLEVYYNGYSDNHLQGFWIKTPAGVYTPDFLIIKRNEPGKYNSEGEKGTINKVLIIETKGKPYYDDEFKQKKKFVEEVFIKHNPKFKFKCFVDDGRNDFKQYLNVLRNLVNEL